jgi:glucose-6-phosphate 1-dehydrogenase
VAGGPEDHLFVIAGGTGDLAARKLVPAIYDLARQDRFGGKYAILGVARSGEHTDETYRKWALDALAAARFTEDDLQAWCSGCVHFHSIGDGEAGDYAALARRISEIEADQGLPGNRTFYLALPPTAVGPSIAALGEAGLDESPGFTRVVFEKPFGHDLSSARELNGLVHSYFDERQVYRIDHYLGKETVQNLLVFRFGNTVFEDLWNRDRIESVQITVAESLGVEDRAAFYERTGAMRDIVQNHLIQLVCLAAMEVPVAFDADSVRGEKVKVLRSIRPLRPEDAVFGQYAGGALDGRDVPGYRLEPAVAPNSRTETFLSMRLDIDSWRWQGVPFYIRTGKRLRRKVTEIAVVFRNPPVCMFESMGSCLLHRNVLRLTLQPDEGFSLEIDVKEPGEPLTIRRIPLDFRYAEGFGELPSAYETLILDVLEGDQTLFVRGDEVEASWEIFDPVLSWDRTVVPYPSGSWGPQEADRLLAREGHRWETA